MSMECQALRCRPSYLMRRLLHLPIAAIAFSTILSTPLHAHEEGHDGKSLGIKVETLAKSTKQWDGDLLPRYPTTQPEVTVLRITIPAGVTLPLHTHPVINAAIIIQGKLQLSLQDGTKHLFKKGDALIEVVNTVHKGKSLGPEDVVVLVVYAGTKDLPTTMLVNKK